MIKVIWQGKENLIDKERVKIEDLLKEFGIFPEAVIVAKNGEVVTEDEVAETGDEIHIIRAISGG
ncbi:MAG: hypothetical protein KatS3mg078_1937 [Deltaproteobacteria bacterium]|jgi:thiamine biosynthesis protein ThiS|nr:MAG: hypothetical protein KatS3mg078_1937 [Deltaproteobacteria bacterium]